MAKEVQNIITAARAFKEVNSTPNVEGTRLSFILSAIKEIADVYNSLFNNAQLTLSHINDEHVEKVSVNIKADNGAKSIELTLPKNATDLIMRDSAQESVLLRSDYRMHSIILDYFGQWLGRVLSTEQFELIASVLEGENAIISYDQENDQFKMRIRLVEDAIEKALQSYTEQTGTPVIDGKIGELTGATGSKKALKVAFDFAVGAACDRLIEKPRIETQSRESETSVSFSMTNYDFLFHAIARSGYYERHQPSKDVEFTISSENFYRLMKLKNKHNVDFSQAIHAMFIDEVRL